MQGEWREGGAPGGLSAVLRAPCPLQEQPPVHKLHQFNGGEHWTPGRLVKCWKTCRQKLQHIIRVSKGRPSQPKKAN